MKIFRRFLPLFAVLFVLSGCSGPAKSQLEQAIAFRTRLLGAAGCRFSAVVTADYGDRRYTFETDCAADREGNLSFTVMSPESLEGISGEIEAEGGKLTFDDTALDFGLLADGQVSPVTCTYMMLKTWRSGYISSAGETEEGLRITFDSSFAEKPLTVDLWLDGTGIPVWGEITFSDRKILTAEIKNFMFLSETEAD